MCWQFIPVDPCFSQRANGPGRPVSIARAVTNQTSNLNVRHEISNEVHTQTIDIPENECSKIYSCKQLPLGGFDGTLKFHLLPSLNLPASLLSVIK